MALAAAVVVAIVVLAALAATIDTGGDDESAESRDPNGAVDGRFDLGDGRELEIRPIPGCEGGYELGDDIIVVPDPDACGFEPVPPGAFGYEVGGKTLLVPSADGDIGGFRLGPDGLELIAPGDLGVGDFLFGFLPDGSLGLVGPDGLSLQPIPGGGLGGGGFGQSVEPPGTDSGGSPILLILAVLAGVAALVAALLFWKRRSDPTDSDDDADTVDFSTEIGALDRLLWEIGQEQDPRAAIRRAYAALETGLGDQRLARHAHETPGVYLQRVLGRFAGLDAPLRELVALFERARFSDHTITPEMRTEAVRALHDIRNRLVAAGESPTSEPRNAAPVPGLPGVAAP